MPMGAPVVDIPSTLKRIDEYLNAGGLLSVDLAEPLMSSPMLWVKSRTEQGLSHRVAENLLVSYFDIPVIDVLPDDVIVISKGYFSASHCILYTTELSDSHFSKNNLGFLTSRPQSIPSVPLIEEVLHAHLMAKFPRAVRHGVRSVIMGDGYWWENWLDKEKILSPITPVEHHWSSSTTHPIHDPADWNSARRACAEKIKGSVRPLVVFAGDIPSRTDADVFVKELLPDEAVAVYTLSPDERIDIAGLKSRLLANSGRVVLFSSARHASDIYAQLRDLIGPELFQTAFNSYFIRISVPKLCGTCQHEEVAAFTDEGLSFSIPNGRYASKGLGCSSCSNGYSGWVVLQEDASGDVRSSFLSAASAFEKQRILQGGYVEPHELQSTLSGYRLIFQEATALPATQTTSVKDLVKALL